MHRQLQACQQLQRSTLLAAAFSNAQQSVPAVQWQRAKEASIAYHQHIWRARVFYHDNSWCTAVAAVLQWPSVDNGA